VTSPNPRSHLIRYGLALIGFALVGSACWLGFSRSPVSKTGAERGTIVWALPGKILTLGQNRWALPREVITFEANLTYPTQVDPDHGFEIVLESRVTQVAESDGSTVPRSKAEELSKFLQASKHEFLLDFPGVQFSPEGPNSAVIDKTIRWEVAPIRTSGEYVAHIRPKESSIVIRGGECSVKWQNPGDLQLRVHVASRSALMDNMKTLTLGLVGSILSFPALLTLYQALKSKKRKTQSP
jgi:hypothetical protein